MNKPLTSTKGKKCKFCEAFYKKYPLKKGRHILGRSVYSAPVECAFTKGVFDHDNWNCETLGRLRDEAQGISIDGEGRYWSRNDRCSASIGVLEIPETDGEDVQRGYLVMTWYKNRGKTGQAWVMCDDNEPEKLTLKTALFIIKSLNN